MDDLQMRVNDYRKKRARNSAISVMLIILGVAILIDS